MYEKLGKTKGPNVVSKVIIAFFVPIGMFIGALATGQQLLQNRFDDKILILVSFLLAVCLTLLVIFIIRAIHSPFKREDCEKR